MDVSYEFGHFRVDVTSRQLLRNGEHVPLPGKAFDTLVVLLRHRDRAVTKDQLIEAVWRDTFVSDDSLTQSISSLRRAFGDAEVIATIPRRGYRFIVPVSEAQGDVAQKPPSSPITSPDPTLGMPCSPAPVTAAPRQRSSRWVAVTVGVAALLLAGSVGWLAGTRRPSDPPQPLRFSQNAPPGTTILSGGVLSPDGRALAFIAEDAQAGTTRLWVRPLAAAAGRMLEGTENAERPFWSPDSQLIGFIANGRLKTVALAGGTPHNLATVRNNYAAGAAWGDGVILFANWRAGLDAVAPSGGPVRAMTSLDDDAAETAHQWPQFLPDRRRFLYVVSSPNPDRAGIYVGSIDEATRVRILDGSHAAAIYAPEGYLLFIRDNALLAQRFDVDRLTLQGAPVSIADAVSAPSIRNGAMISAAAGGLISFGGGTSQRRLAWYDRRGTRLATIDAPATLTNPMFSPDEKQLFAVSFEPDSQGVWVLDLERGAPNRLIVDATLPVASPRGDMIAFASLRGAGVFDMFVRRLGGANDDEPLLQTNESKFVNDWSRDGRFIVFGSSNAKTGEDLWLLPTFGDRTPVPYLLTPYNEIQSRVSPDGRWMAYTSDESGMLEVYLQSFPSAGGKQIVSIRGGAEPVWRGDGRELYYLAADRTLMAVDIEGRGDTVRVSRPRALFRAPVSGPLNVYRSHYSATADGQRFVVDAVDTDRAQESITVLADWTALLP